MDWNRVVGSTLMIKVLKDLYRFGKFYPKDCGKPLKFLGRKVDFSQDKIIAGKQATCEFGRCE